MTKAQFQALGLTEEQSKACEKASLEELTGYVSAETHKTLTTEKEQLEQSAKDHEKQLETLKKSSGDVESLKQEIESLQKSNKEREDSHSKELHQLKVDSAVETAILSAGGLNAKAVRALLDLNEAKLNSDGSVVGLSEQMGKLQKAEDSKFLFQDKNAAPPMKGAKLGESRDGGSTSPFDVTKEQLKSMSMKERFQFSKANPEQYKQAYEGGIQ